MQPWNLSPLVDPQGTDVPYMRRPDWQMRRPDWPRVAVMPLRPRPGEGVPSSVASWSGVVVERWDIKLDAFSRAVPVPGDGGRSNSARIITCNEDRWASGRRGLLLAANRRSVQCLPPFFGWLDHRLDQRLQQVRGVVVAMHVV